MKKILILLLMALCCNGFARNAQLKNRIAVLDFQPSSTVQKGDAEANKLSAKLEQYNAAHPQEPVFEPVVVVVEEEPAPAPKPKKDHWKDKNSFGVSIGTGWYVNNLVYATNAYLPDMGISYQRVLSHNRRFEIGIAVLNNYHGSYNLGGQEWRNAAYNGLNGNVTHQWLWQLHRGVHVYTGAGVSIGRGAFGLGKETGYNMGFGVDLGMLGVAGLEWKFNIPLTLTLDVRPWLHIVHNEAVAFTTAVNLGCRFTFGQPKPGKERRVMVN